MAITKLVSDSLGAGVGGSMVLIQTQTVSSSVSSVDFTTGFGTYDTIQFILSDVRIATDATNFRMLFSTDGGSTFDTSNYSTSGHWDFAGGSDARLGTSTTYAVVNGSMGNESFETLGSDITINNMNSTSTYKNMYNVSTCNHDTSSQIVSQRSGSSFKTTSAINGIRFFAGSGNIVAGKFSMYGVNQ